MHLSRLPPLFRSRRWVVVSLPFLLATWACMPADEPAPGTASTPAPSAQAETQDAQDAAASRPSEPPVTTQTTDTTSDEPWTRVTWTRDVDGGTDFFSLGEQLVLMAYDSRDGQGERELIAARANYTKPLITPSGAEVVFSVRGEGAVYAIRWDGSGHRRIADGFALAVWSEPDTGDEWIYVGDDEAPTDPPSYRTVYLYRLDSPEAGELVWDAQPVSGDGFQLSADGRYAGALLPWPTAGVADLTAGTWKELGDGCWTAFAGDGNHLFWYFDGSHRNLTLVDLDTDDRWQVAINGAPGIDGFEVYHPRWTNDSRYLVTTGPYTVGRRDNKIRGGGNQVEIWLGRFSRDLSNVEHWRQITHNDSPDFYPDAWIDPSHIAPEGERLDAIIRATSDGVASARLVVDVRVRQDAPVPTPQSIAPYTNGLQALEYDVLEVIEGTYDESLLVVAHWVIRDSEILEAAARPTASTYRLTVELYDTHPELEGERLVMDTTAFALPLYYDVDSLP